MIWVSFWREDDGADLSVGHPLQHLPVDAEDLVPWVPGSLVLIAIHHTTLHYSSLQYTTLQNTTLHYTTLHYTKGVRPGADQCYSSAGVG